MVKEKRIRKLTAVLFVFFLFMGFLKAGLIMKCRNLWATQIIAGGLNEYCGYEIDTSIYDESNYTMTEWKECWLGEQGRHL